MRPVGITHVTMVMTAGAQQDLDPAFAGRHDSTLRWLHTEKNHLMSAFCTERVTPMSTCDPESDSVERPAVPQTRGLASRMNWLRAGVLGANDGIISTAGLVVGVAAIGADRGPIVTAGFAGLVAGAISMALGEYVSVSSQRDTERSLLSGQRADLEADPQRQCAQLAALYQAKGMSPLTAWTVAEELTRHDAFAAHIDAELGIDPDALVNPWHAAAASAASFTIGALFPLVAILLAPQAALVPVTVAVVVLALIITGTISASLGRANRLTAALRLVIGGALAMAVTYGVGQLFTLATG